MNDMLAEKDSLTQAIRDAAFTVKEEDDACLIVSKHDVVALMAGSQDGLAILEFSSNMTRRGNARQFLAELSAVVDLHAEDVDWPPQEGCDPAGYQKFWARMARESLVASMSNPDGDHVTADEIDPPGASRNP